MAQPADTPPPGDISQPAESLRDEYEATQRLYEVQPPLIQRFIESQASQIADAYVAAAAQVRFTLPDRVIVALEEPARSTPVPVPAGIRECLVGGLVDRITGTGIRLAIRQRLAELEESPERSVAASARLIRHATSVHMVHRMLPAGRSVTYVVAENDVIPTIPAGDEYDAESAITAATDVIVEEGGNDTGRGDLVVPYVPAARRFYLPQWVAFDDQDRLLVKSVAEAEADVASMQRFLGVLHASVAVAPYMVADNEYQRKRYGILGQLVNQGRALARYEAREIIETVRRRAAAQDLNRGLSLSVPYFDDQAIVMQYHDMEVIPAGRIPFLPGFLVRAARLEQAKVAQDTRLSASTRRHLLENLGMLERAFASGSPA